MKDGRGEDVKDLSEPPPQRGFESQRGGFLFELYLLAKRYYPDLDEETYKAMAADMEHASRYLGAMP